jgi:hypothetical protein
MKTLTIWIPLWVIIVAVCAVVVVVLAMRGAQ